MPKSKENLKKLGKRNWKGGRRRCGRDTTPWQSLPTFKIRWIHSGQMFFRRSCKRPQIIENVHRQRCQERRAHIKTKNVQIRFKWLKMAKMTHKWIFLKTREAVMEWGSWWELAKLQTKRTQTAPFSWMDLQRSSAPGTSPFWTKIRIYSQFWTSPVSRRASSNLKCKKNRWPTIWGVRRQNWPEN